MLTEDGYRERLWRGYPVLRRLVEQKEDPVPHGIDLVELVDGIEPRLSTDHGPLGRLADVLAIGRLLGSQATRVQEAMRADRSSAESVEKEICQLLDEMERRCLAFQQDLARAFRRELDVTRTTLREIQESSRRVGS